MRRPRRGLGATRPPAPVSLVIGLNEGRRPGRLRRTKKGAMLHRGYPRSRNVQKKGSAGDQKDRASASPLVARVEGG